MNTKDRLHKLATALRLRHSVGDESGVTIVEFALCSVILLMTILGTLEFGLAVWRYNMVSDLAQEGARWAAVRGTNGSIHATAAQVAAYVDSRANGMAVVTTTTSAVSQTAACSTTVVDPGTLNQFNAVCVTVASSYSPLAGFFPASILNFNSTAKMVMAR